MIGQNGRGLCRRWFSIHIGEKNEIAADAFVAEALRQGAAEVRFIRPDPFLRWKSDAKERLYGVRQLPLCPDPKALLREAKSVAVLFFASAPFPEDDAPFPRYYVQSHRGYHAARALTAYLQAHGVEAVHGTRLPARAAALRSGGMAGDNGLYIHPRFGSYVHIELIVNDVFWPRPDGEVVECTHCGQCQGACPTKAIGLRELLMRHCLRNHLYQKDMPVDMRGHVYQLLGCERCQRVCPHSRDVAPVPITQEQRDALSFERLLYGSLAPAKATVGSNLARRSILVPQAILVMGAQGLPEYRALLNGLREAGQSIAYLDWALSREIDGNV